MADNTLTRRDNYGVSAAVASGSPLVTVTQFRSQEEAVAALLRSFAARTRNAAFERAAAALVGPLLPPPPEVLAPSAPVAAESCATGDPIGTLADAIEAGMPLSGLDRRMAAAGIRLLARRQHAAELRLEALRERGELVRKLAAQSGGSHRERARQIVTLATRYAASAWPREQHNARCPHVQGTQQELLWRLLMATGGKVPSQSTIRREIGSRST